MAEYRLVSVWRLEAPLSEVYDAVYKSLHWPDWWQGAKHVEQTDPGDAHGIGSVRRYTWKSRLRYGVTFDAIATRIVPHALLEAKVRGDLEGTGTWHFTHNEGITTVRYEWRVCTTRRWMNILAPVARSMFEQNHHALMQNGAEGLGHLLKAPLLNVSHDALPPESGNSHGWHSSDPASAIVAAIVAGFSAGVAATFVQLALWWAFAIPLPDILFRDARLAAAIVMGRTVLPPPATFEWNVMMAASLVHFALSICYGLILAPLVSRLELRQAMPVGALFGLLLYGTNMYGFTAVFPWFEATRDWITLAAHVSFGVAAAGIYGMWRNNSRTAG